MTDAEIERIYAAGSGASHMKGLRDDLVVDCAEEQIQLEGEHFWLSEPL